MNKLFLSLALIALSFSTMAYKPSLQKRLSVCAELKNDVKRLACYDKLVRKKHHLKEAKDEISAVRTVPEVAPKVTAAKASVAEKEFGIEHKISRTEDAPDSMTATVTSVKKNAYGKLRITLDNGQKWIQSDSGKLKLKKGEQVVITRASLGSFKLNRVGKKKAIKVKRQK